VHRSVVSTRVVSWKEAAEMKLRVCSEALVMPSRNRLGERRRPPRASPWRFFVELRLVRWSPLIRPVARLEDFTFCSI